MFHVEPNDDKEIDVFKHTPNLVASIAGTNIRPIKGGRFSGVVGVPEKFFADDNDLDALERYLDSEENPSLPMRCVAFNFEGKS
jgi:hypothetical protein